jgi:hypothetical protein
MIDEIFDRNYQAARADMNAGLDRGSAKLGRALANSFRALHRVQWSAPWLPQAKDVGHS